MLPYRSPLPAGEATAGHWATRRERIEAGFVDWLTVWLLGSAIFLALTVVVGDGAWLPIFVKLWLILHLGLDAICSWTLGRKEGNIVLCTEDRGMPTRMQVALRAMLQRPWIWAVLTRSSMGIAPQALHVRNPDEVTRLLSWLLVAAWIWWLLNSVLCVLQNRTLVDRLSGTRLASVDLS